MKKYIVDIENIGELTTVAAMQNSKIFLEKDDKSSFYIVHLENDVVIPENIKALEMLTTGSEKVNDDKKDEKADKKNFLDLRLCIEIPRKVDKKEVEEILCKEISKTLKTFMRREK
jgi:hypothetical protein